MASIREDICASAQIDRLIGSNNDSEIIDYDHIIEGTIHLFEWVEAGLAVRHAGLIYLLPLCHDSEIVI